MSAATTADCPACGAPVSLLRIAVMPDFDRHFCGNCKASLQRTSPIDPALREMTIALIVVIQLMKLSTWFALLFPLLLLTEYLQLKRRLPTTTFKLSEPWSLRS
jgi:uncharacterized paraquat-inducible protein A